MPYPGINSSGKRDASTYTESGTTAERPTTAKLGYTVPIGFEFFDTTLGKPIWWNGTTWITDFTALPAGTLASQNKVGNIPAPAAVTAYAAVVDMTAQVTKAEGEAVSAALHTLQTDVTALRATVAALLVAMKVGVMTAD